MEGSTVYPSDTVREFCRNRSKDYLNCVSVTEINSAVERLKNKRGSRMDYEDKSDYEINKEVSKYWDVISKHLDLEDTEITFNDENETVYVIAENGVFEWLPVTYFDPCKNPNDAWVIIVENKISTSPTGDSWICGSSVFGTQTIDKNPLRAAMICFLKMKDEEEENNE